MKKIFNPLTVIITLLVIASCVKPRLDDINYFNNGLNLGVDSSNDLTINEFCAHSPNYLDSDGGLPAVSNHWLELYNPGDTAINFATNGNYYLTDDSTNPNLYQLITFTIPSKGYMLVITDSPVLANVTHMHANFHTSKSGGFLGLYKKVNGTYMPLTKHLFAAQTSHYSEGRLPDNGKTWYDFAVPTPLGPNSSNGGITLAQYQ